ncbi:MAG: transposase, partial [Candidatus Tectomicrobia bacterium]|nr:transposase [Candidatus Tectomicrobia bacterium]
DDQLVKVSPLLEIVGDWKLFLSSAEEEETMNDIRKHERTGRPLGNERFTEPLERIMERTLRRQKPGPKGARKLQVK